MNIIGGSYTSDHFWELEGETRNKAVLSNTVENYFLHRSCWNRCLLTSNLAQHWKQKVSDSLKPLENSLFQFSASDFQLVWLSFIITHLAKTPTPKFLSFDLLSILFSQINHLLPLAGFASLRPAVQLLSITHSLVSFHFLT